MTGDEQEDRVDLTPYQAAGEIEGITKLVDEFYVNMEALPEAKIIRDMHPPDLAESRKKLTYAFRSGTRNGMPGCCACSEPWPSSHSAPN